MKRITLITGLLIALSSHAFAQEAPPVEIFAGYSNLRPDRGGRLHGGGSMHGWNASVTVRVARWLEIDSDLSGHYGRQSFSAEISNSGFPENILVSANSDTNIHTFLVGPRLSYRGNKKLTPFVRSLFGVSRIGTDATIRTGPLAVDSAFADLGFAFAFGGGLDVKLSESIGLRLIQADYLVTNFGGQSQGNVRLSFGFTLR